MKLTVIIFLFTCAAFTHPGNSNNPVSPLSVFSTAWNAPRFLKCNTAARALYMSTEERELIYIFNMARMDPALFDSTVVRQYPQHSGDGFLINIAEYKSLLDTMATIEPLPLLYPDQRCYNSAQCHAQLAGQNAYVGHVRQNSACKKLEYFDGECCDYGRYTPLDILMGLLIDQGVPGLGHRFLCLSDYHKIGLSIQPHKEYGINAVLDFKY